ncbi:MAG: hypothetical protein IKB82_00160 [Clostridia bacterium]|nr:hypothetical protein [Clostridia bacterium]
MANGVMTIKYGSEQIASKANKAIGELSDIGNRLGGVRKKLSGIPERSRWGDNLSTASSFLRKKIEQMERREAALETLKTRANEYMSKVETTEKKLSSQIKKEFKQFNKQTGIGKTRAALLLEKLKTGWDSMKRFFLETIPYYGKKIVKEIWEGVKSVGQAICTWYQEHKEAIRLFFKGFFKVVYAAVAIYAAITAAIAITAATGGVGLALAIAVAIGGVTSAVDAVMDAWKTAKAFGYAAKGENAKAREIDSMSVAEYFFDSPAGQKIYNIVITTGSILGIVGSVGNVVKGAWKALSSGTVLNKVKVFLKEMGKGLLGFDDFKTWMDMGHIKIPTWSQKIDIMKGVKVYLEWMTLKPIADIVEIVDKFKSGKTGGGILGVLGFVT